jgi:hypothetical protein
LRGTLCDFNFSSFRRLDLATDCSTHNIHS